MGRGGLRGAAARARPGPQGAAPARPGATARRAAGGRGRRRARGSATSGGLRAGRDGRSGAAGAGALARRGVRSRGHDPTPSDDARRPRARCGSRAATPYVVALLRLRGRGGGPGRSGRRPSAPPTSPARWPADGAGLARAARRHDRARSSWSATTCSPPGRPLREAQRALEAVGLPACTAVAGGGRDPPTSGGTWPGAFRRRAPRTNVWSWSPSGSVVASFRRPAGPPAGRQGDKPMPVAGETVHVRRRRAALRSAARSRCGLEVSPASPRRSDAVRGGRRPVVAEGEAANASAGDCGVEDQVGRTDSSPGTHPNGCPVPPPGRISSQRRRFTWRSWSRVVTARSTDRFRSHVAEKLTRAGEARPPDHPGPRRGGLRAQPAPARPGVHVELTAFSKGPVIRAEAAADDKMGALDLALDKMAAQMRRAADRRRVHRGRRTPGLGRPGAGRRAHPPPATLVDELTSSEDERRPSTRSARSRSPATGRWWCARRPTRPAR